MKQILLFLCFLTIAASARAQLTLDECRRLARAHYPQIRQYGLIAQSTQFTLSNARRAWLPQLSLSAQATWQTDVMDFPDQFKQLYAQMGIEMIGLHKDQYKAALELNQTLWDGGKSRADRQIAQADDAAAQRSVDVDLYALEGRIDELFFGILLLDERIEQTHLTLDLLRSNLDKIRTLHANGLATASDADAVEAQLLTVGQQLTDTRSSRDSYRRMLALFLGRTIDDEPLVRPKATRSTVADSLRPELALFEANAGKLTAQESLVRSATRPRFGIFAQGYYGYPGLNMFEDMLHDRWSWNAVVGVKMQWNFGGYYTRSNSLRLLRNAQQQVGVQRDIFLFNNRLQATEQDGRITRLRQALANDEQIVALRRSIRQAAESQLRNGVIDTNDLLQKITDESTAAIARSAHEIELLKTIYELRHTLNQ